MYALSLNQRIRNCAKFATQLQLMKSNLVLPHYVVVIQNPSSVFLNSNRLLCISSVKDSSFSYIYM